MSVVVVGVGTNLGAREAAIRSARDLLGARDDLRVLETSPIYETAPLGPPQDDYLNAAFRLETSLAPTRVLDILLRTERRLGRVRSADQRWGPRSVDLDLLWDERGEHSSKSLRVPHPELANRDFALAPLLDVAPELEGTYGDALADAGGAPSHWRRAAVVRREEGVIEVEADSLADACALSGSLGADSARPWSTQHVDLHPGPEAFAAALQSALRSGLSVGSITVSHCSEAQWTAQFHGVNRGAPVAKAVKLEVASGVQRRVRVRLSINPSPV